MSSSNKNITYLKRCKLCGNDNLEKVIEIDPNYVGAYNNIGVVLLIIENNQGAKIKFEKAGCLSELPVNIGLVCIFCFSKNI